MDVMKTCDLMVDDSLKEDEDIVLCLPKGIMLREANMEVWEIESKASVLNYVFSRGMKDIVRIKGVKDNKLYYKFNDKAYILLDKHSNERLNLNTKENAIIASGLLSEFHNATIGYEQPPGTKLVALWGIKMDKFKRMTCVLERFSDRMMDKASLNEFEIAANKYMDILFKRAYSATKILRSSNYIDRLEESMGNKEICLNSIGISKKSDGSYFIDGIKKISYNMIEEDIALLIKKAIESSKNNTVFTPIIDEYKRHRDLSEDSIKIIKALVSYPYNSIKTIEKYMKKPNKETRRLCEKFIKYIEKEKEIELSGV